MTTPIRPSLAQMLNPQPVAARPNAQPQTQAGAFASTVVAQKAFFQQVTQPKITPANYTAADIAQATKTVQPAAAPATQPDQAQALKRPGSFLNIIV